MIEERSVADKYGIAPRMTYENLIANPPGDNTFHRLTIAGLTAQPTKGPGGHLYEIALFGLTAPVVADRSAGTIWVQFVREPTDPNDQFGPCPFPISKDDPWFGAALQATLYTAGNITSIAIEYMTHVPGLRLKNRIYKAWT